MKRTQMQKYFGALTPMNFSLGRLKQDQESQHFNLWCDGLEGKKQMLPYLIVGISMIRKRDKIWTAIIETKQQFSKLFTSEADALVDDFGNNPPPKIGTHSYSGDIHDKRDKLPF